MDHSRQQLTLSYDGVHLLFRSEDLATHVIHTVLYDGHETYIMDSNSRIAEIDPGFDFSRMIFCPLPGVGVPNAPLLFEEFPGKMLPEFIRRLAPIQNSEPKYIDKSLYQMSGQTRDYGIYLYSDPEAFPKGGGLENGPACVVSVPTSSVPKVIWYDTFDNIAPNIGTIWEFYSHQSFEGIWLATKIGMRSYGTIAPGKNVLLQEATYNLENANNGPLEPSAYQPETYLLNHANIGDMTGLTVKAFIYYEGRGSLQSQRQNERERIRS